jgi:predicted small lipoprotein YifL
MDGEKKRRVSALSGLILAGSLLLSACGQRGPLYLPTPPAAPPPRPAAPAAAPPTPAQTAPDAQRGTPSPVPSDSPTRRRTD